MSDPFSAASGAVGVISLGLTVCQGLASYYEAWNSQDQEIRSVVRDLHAVTKSLALVEQKAKHDRFVDVDALNHLQDVIASTQETIQELNKILTKCKETTPAASVKQKIQIVSQRLLYPFRQATIQRLQTAVKSTQQNVALALQTFQL